MESGLLTESPSGEIGSRLMIPPLAGVDTSHYIGSSQTLDTLAGMVFGM